MTSQLVPRRAIRKFKLRERIKKHYGYRESSSSSSTGEETLRAFLDKVFEVKFKKQRPKWLKGLELDCFNSELKIAFEHQGQQHFTGKFFKGQALKYNILKRDRLKQRLCKKQGVELIEIPDLVFYFRLDEAKI